MDEAFFFSMRRDFKNFRQFGIYKTTADAGVNFAIFCLLVKKKKTKQPTPNNFQLKASQVD